MSTSYETSTPEAARVGEDASIRSQLALLREQQERLFDSMQSGQRHFKKLARSVWRVQEEERRRLARDLHDGIGQNLTALRHQLDALAAEAADPGLRQRLQAAGSLCAATLEDTRELSRMLRPQILDDLGLGPALSWLARSVAATAGFRAEVETSGLPESLDGDVATLLVRVAQEALANASKHARATQVLVRAARRGSEITLLVVDDGAGCDPEAARDRNRQGLSGGLGGMRERVELFGGTLQFASAAGEGTQVRVVVPLQESAH